ncbi:MAG: AraC family transcriptional regulator, partial [Erysipelotrichia bacterium]|nr:AraC family transcriptional regulator [Erysipelotrichia bacterium]
KYTVKVDDYSRKLGISTRTLTNLLNKYTGKSTKIYLNEFLHLEIKRYLLDENLTIQEISDKLDFDELTNLVKFFKKFEKMTPSEYRKINS